ncbi:MAG: YheC/YheD family protein [Clostridiaceae bacterium]|nr:YheC/YheD family protein [Clostridiaceae bacterium]
MWINIEIVSQNKNVIYLPKSMIRRKSTYVDVSFGQITINALVKPLNNIEEVTGDDFENPIKIRLSDKLSSRLYIQEELTYKIKYKAKHIEIGPVVGILLGSHNNMYNSTHMKKYSDRFGVYNQVGGLICAFSPNTIDWKKRVAYGLYYNNLKSQWKFATFPIPSVIYRRDFHLESKNINKLIQITRDRMFNSSRFTKFYLYEHAKENKKLVTYLPETELCENYKKTKKFIEKNTDVILKPTNLSRGRGICIIKKRGDGYKVLDYRNREVKEIDLLNNEALKEFFDKNKDLFREYLIQKYILLAKIDGSPFDIRVVMQKTKPYEWKCSGIECRVAAPKTLVTNISKGGYAIKIDDALKRAFTFDENENKEIKKNLYNLCLEISNSLDRTSQHYAEFGMDIALDEQGGLWIIEVNVFPSFKGFKKMDYNTYLDIRHNPIFYASRISGFSNNT